MHAAAHHYLTLAEAAQQAPGRPSFYCVWRWCRRGIRARNGQTFRLTHVRIGGKLYTTLAWVEAFGRQVAEGDAAHFETRRGTRPPRVVPRSRAAARRQAQLDAANGQLDAAGL